jgi:uncharacterized SAM-binding protein YcdF (DUF218 family)
MYDFLVYLAQPHVILSLLLTIGLARLWWKCPEMRRRLLWAIVPFGLLLLLSTPVAAYLALGTLEWQHPPLTAVPDDAGAIVVLSGYVLPADQVRPEPELAADTLCRCLLAARLYQQGKPRPILVSGGQPKANEPGTHAQAMRDFLLTQGVAPADIWMEDRSRTTHENAVYSAERLRERKVGKVVLVSTASHLPRAVRCFRAQGVEVVPAGCEYQATQLADFLPSPSAAEKVQIAVHEWLGLLWYWLRGRI